MRCHWARWRAFVHATEDEDRVRDAVVWLMAQEEAPKGNDRIERQRAKGHWGNDIVVLQGALTKRDAIDAALHRIFDANRLREAVALDLQKALDEDEVLHVRLDKQAAVGREVKQTAGGDAIVFTVKVERLPGGSALEEWRRFFAR